MKREGQILKGSFFLGLGAFISKLLGALYRIPLLNLITSKGIGLYQMVFPVYCILLDFAGSGAPNAIAKLVSQKGEDRDYSANRYVKSSVALFLFLGLFFSFVMLLFAKPIARLQGNSDAYLGYVFLSPSITFVSLISCFRGYFQGKLNMLPTAISQIIEQLVKLVFGLFFAYLFMPNIFLAVGGTTLAVSISEATALIYLYLMFRRKNKTFSTILLNKKEKMSDVKDIIKLTIPITLIGIAIPFSNLIDSFFVVNILKKYLENAVSLFGLFSGATLSIINLPVSICYGVSVVAIPLLSGEKNKNKRSKNTKKTILLTLIIAIPFAIGCFFFANFIVNILYRSMTIEEKGITTRLIRLSSINVVLLSLLQTENSILISYGKHYYPLISMGVAIVVKTIILIILLNIQSINIYGASIGLIACYFVAVLINFIIIITLGEKCKSSLSKSATT